MQFSLTVILAMAASVAVAAPVTDEKRACFLESTDDVNFVKRCAIPWTKNYGEYEKRACFDVSGEDGKVIKRCAIPWTKNYGEYEDEQ
ncbi:hypothetical protein F4678DRAFT_464583 [Xylaria arbuscula]|nr:hypothetical protein F4678DRAFT_464583 [Xylaria arbuscula]